ncbi:hypothetical protein Q31b_49310 [Novipirellula aureliae]|uniref:Uncharacterized protein n=1 Tax=Novipirellula aureliae TaxID=2527966 RepID=A0A5C6DIH1_9BACT|nr:hypothetical protein [Novipirellula aureliae]TWU36650.1 hypothetical protein Q31b_49310 [Novipirellula aureliae]
MECVVISITPFEREVLRDRLGENDQVWFPRWLRRYATGVGQDWPRPALSIAWLSKLNQQQSQVGFDGQNCNVRPHFVLLGDSGVSAPAS